eukprot:gene6152-24558_t
MSQAPGSVSRGNSPQGSQAVDVTGNIAAGKSVVGGPGPGPGGWKVQAIYPVQSITVKVHTDPNGRCGQEHYKSFAKMNQKMRELLPKKVGDMMAARRR